MNDYIARYKIPIKSSQQVLLGEEVENQFCGGEAKVIRLQCFTSERLHSSKGKKFNELHETTDKSMEVHKEQHTSEPCRTLQAKNVNTELLGRHRLAQTEKATTLETLQHKRVSPGLSTE